MESAYLKLVDSGRIRNYMGLEMDAGKEYTHGVQYLYIEVPLRMPKEEVKRNQHVFLEAAGSLNVVGRSPVEVEPNPALAEFGTVSPGYKVHPTTGKHQIGLWFTARKDLDVSQIQYLVRLYLYA